MEWSCLRLLLVLCCLVYRSQPNEAARILGLFALPGKSHFIMFQEVMKCLADAGHQVDVVSHFPQKKPYPNYTDVISLEGKSAALMNSISYQILKTASVTVSMGDRIQKVGTNPCYSLDSPELQKLIRSPPNDPPYDLVITEYFFAHCYFAFGRHLGVPVVAVASTSTMSHANEAFGNPANTGIVSEIAERPVSPMNFWQRLKNTVFVAYTNKDIKYHIGAQNDIVKKHFGPEMPDIEQLERELSLLLVNSHYIFHGIRPMTPAIVEVSGLHVRDGTPLPKDLQKWLDDSKDGFVYFSLGSMAKLESFPEAALAEIYSAFEKISPIRILMKVASPNELPPGLPDNVKTLTWAPQVQVLKHKNIRGFMTHGGLMGLQEAVTFGVPLIGMPLFGDQSGNVHMLVERGVAVALDYQNLEADKIVAAVNALAYDPKYKKNVIAVSKQFVDRPLNVRNTTVFWIEYILKHGKDALRSPALKLMWWELALLDVYGTIIAVVLVFLYGIKFIFSTIIARFANSNRTSPPSKKKK